MGCVSNCDTDYKEFAEKPIGWQIPGKYYSSTKVKLIWEPELNQEFTGLFFLCQNVSCWNSFTIKNQNTL